MRFRLSTMSSKAISRASDVSQHGLAACDYLGNVAGKYGQRNYHKRQLQAQFDLRQDPQLCSAIGAQYQRSI